MLKILKIDDFYSPHEKNTVRVSSIKILKKLNFQKFARRVSRESACFALSGRPKNFFKKIKARSQLGTYCRRMGLSNGV